MKINFEFKPRIIGPKNIAPGPAKMEEYVKTRLKISQIKNLIQAINKNPNRTAR